VYLAAMEKGYTPDTLAEDAQFEYNGWSPRNASGKYAGTVTLRQGLAYSLNTIAARLAIDVTPQAVVDVATRMGISSHLTAVPSIALGTQEVNLLELTGAYAPFANGGMGVIPNVITKIETKDGKPLYEASDAGPGRVIAPNVLDEMNDMLETAVEVGTGKGANLNGWQFGGKTGTSQNARDALFVGYTAAMVTGVWLGNDNDTKTTLSGGNVPAVIWSEFMTKAHAGKQIAQIPHGSYDSQTVAQPVIDPATGQQAIDPATGQPMVQHVDAQTGQPVAPPSNQPIQTGQMVDPMTGLPVGQQVVDPNAQAIDPATGMPMQQGGGFQQGPAVGVGTTAPIDPDTGMPMVLVVDPSTGQQVWVPSAPAQQQQQGQFAPPQPVGGDQVIYQEPEQPQQRTLMDLIFGN
jgi:penicillin-binding protein 1A